MQNRTPTALSASRAYAASSAHRSLREQEADVFRHANAMLRHAKNANSIGRSRALADNNRLWGAVLDSVRDPGNALPDSLRAAIVSVGLSVQREMAGEAPDFEFLISINNDIAAGLCGL